MKAIYTESPAILAASLQNLFVTMQLHVDKFVEAYKSDFEVDKSTITADPDHEYLWLIRRCGTQLVDLTELQASKCSIEGTSLYWYWHNVEDKQVYLVSIGKVQRLYKNSVLKIFKKYKEEASNNASY